MKTFLFAAATLLGGALVAANVAQAAPVAEYPASR